MGTAGAERVQCTGEPITHEAAAINRAPALMQAIHLTLSGYA